MKIHDSGYKRLFSNKTIFRQLIETFVEEPWIQELDFAHATRIDKSFVSEHYKETESDIIYRVPLRHPDGSEREVYFYVLIEFQSTVQRFMVLRVLHYITSLYLDHLLTYGVKETLQLPAVLPILLYNGDESWTAPTALRDLIADYPPLGNYHPHFEYLKIAENEFSLGRLLGIRNLISALFIVEAHYDLSLLEELVLALYDEEPDREAIYLFLNWLKQLALYGKIDENAYGSLARAVQNKEEVKSMFLTAFEREKAKVRDAARKEGLDEGHKEGHKEGRKEQATQIALTMLTRGFMPEQIADLTGLPVEVVLQLRDQPPTVSTSADAI